MDKRELLTRDETVKLITEANAGSSEALEELVLKNMALVRSIALRYRGRAETEDLIQIGAMGLLKAIRGFDSGMGTQFSTYAVPRIAGEIKRFLRDDGPIKLSRRLKETAIKAAAASRKLCTALGRSPTVEELARELNCDSADIAAAMDAVQPPASLDGTLLADTLPAKGLPEDEATMRVLLTELLRELAPQERRLLFLRYIKQKTQKETAAALGTNQTAISRMERCLLERLQNNIF